KTSQVRAVPEKASAAATDQSATRPSRPWTTRRVPFFASAALASASTATPDDTPTALQPAVPAAHAIDATVRNAPPTTNRLSSRKRELSFMTEHLLCAAPGDATRVLLQYTRRVVGGCLLSGGGRPARLAAHCPPVVSSA